MTMLALETSTPCGSVVLCHEDGSILFEETFRAERTHSAALFGVLERALALDHAPSVIAVGLGPGSYAGVRVAIAAAIGLQIALGAELRGIPSIAALPLDLPCYHVIGDARRGSFFLAKIRNASLEAPPELWPMEELEQHISGLEHLYTTEPFPAVSQAGMLAPSARRVAQLARAPGFSGPSHTLEPLYLRDPHITVARSKPLRPSPAIRRPSPGS